MLRHVVRHHHERYDGGGYPDGLVGPEIPVEARIVTVADVLDALTTERPYKAAWSLDESLAFLRAHAGRAFDPACVEALEACRPEIEDTIVRWRDAGPPSPMHDVLGTWWMRA
jgi:HD-GYP domain-containing protein (c-di-GMP phosphodiesterase class II)